MFGGTLGGEAIMLQVTFLRSTLSQAKSPLYQVLVLSYSQRNLINSEITALSVNEDIKHRNHTVNQGNKNTVNHLVRIQ